MPNIYMGSTKIKSIYVGTTKLKSVYVGGTKVWSSGIALSTLPIGTLVNLVENGTDTPYVIVQKGLPSNLYDTSCDGIWLLRKYIHSNRNWNSANQNSYSDSSIHSYLNNDFISTFSEKSKNAIKQVKIPYRVGTAGFNVNTGFNGLSTKAFLLSYLELGGYESEVGHYCSKDGDKLEYFISDAVSVVGARERRIAYLSSGTISNWSTRSHYKTGNALIHYVFTSGVFDNELAGKSFGVRPAVILNNNTQLMGEPNSDGSYNILE